mgnify:CR=1 FL=1
MITVREARPDDADALAAAHIEGWRVGYRGLVPDEYLDAPRFAEQRLDTWRAWTWGDNLPGSQVFVAERAGRVVGFGFCGPARVDPTCDQISAPTGGGVSTTLGEVYAFYVHPDAWGSGAAPALMARCHEYLHDNGYERAVLWVLRDNPRARAFYEKSGWLTTGAESQFAGPQSAGGPLPWSLTEVEYAHQW